MTDNAPLGFPGLTKAYPRVVAMMTCMRIGGRAPKVMVVGGNGAG